MTPDADRSQRRFLILLAAILAYATLLPICLAFGLDFAANPLVARATFLILLLAAVMTTETGARMRLTVGVLGALCFVVGVGLVYRPNRLLEFLSIVATVAFMAPVFWITMRHVFRTSRVDVDTVAACLCAYLMIGLVWANLYGLIEIVDASAFDYPEHNTESMSHVAGSSATAIYFSFVTLSTLGYGDVVPISTPARLLSALQAMIGQLFLAVIVARIVGMHLTSTEKSDDQT